MKWHTDSRELADYIEKIDSGLYRRMFLSFILGKPKPTTTVSVIGPEKLAELVVDAALVA